jgi:hypothetical protein
MSPSGCILHSREDVRLATRRTWARAFLVIVLTALTAACSNPVTPTDTETTSTTTTTTTQDPPTVTDVSPKSGSADGGTTVTITGTGFTSVTSLVFGGTAVAKYTVDSDTSITATTPAVAAGVVDVLVTTSGGSSAVAEADWFEFAANALTDASFLSAAVAPGLPMRGSVSVTFPAPSGGITIPLTWSVSGGTGAVLYPLTTSIAAGATTSSFQVTTFFVSSPVTVRVTAEHGGQTRTAGFVIAGP